ncbi:Programmed cell death antitoxin MazE [Parasaccharibacter apium]|uniref:Programmed cell death antitoxin MazE n=1 Tax=Parasaccharibacter apium TaxID=1510841 RepID=A0A7U7G6B8_9PROT|nr:MULTISPECIES: AbrB/MazE/SpoVT family DNA-binding domain-containing protein [Acetobacteraceae]MBS0964220.1 AbrB/MazE/SpoVT family DNA-binding domain-containing protein [Acetobacter persici]MCL1513297.1 AbrB/MazE/SpoVT family DNA-binding domain-containing protein [Parasaccharibacter sp. TMW 2.1891]CDG33957.1 Programmed cell death antitoxin MazE [Parasaccharibacter apium]
MQGVVRKWGNSAAIRLPAGVLEAVSLKIDQAVDVREEDGRIIIEPVRAVPLKLEELVSGITNENRHDEMDFGPSVGGESW